MQDWTKSQEQIEKMKKDKQVSSRKRRKASVVAGSNETKRTAWFPESEMSYFCPTIYEHAGIRYTLGYIVIYLGVYWHLLNPIINQHAVESAEVW